MIRGLELLVIPPGLAFVSLLSHLLVKRVGWRVFKFCLSCLTVKMDILIIHLVNSLFNELLFIKYLEQALIKISVSVYHYCF